MKMGTQQKRWPGTRGLSGDHAQGVGAERGLRTRLQASDKGQWKLTAFRAVSLKCKSQNLRALGTCAQINEGKPRFGDERQASSQETDTLFHAVGTTSHKADGEEFAGSGLVSPFSLPHAGQSISETLLTGPCPGALIQRADRPASHHGAAGRTETTASSTTRPALAPNNSVDRAWGSAGHPHTSPGSSSWDLGRGTGEVSVLTPTAHIASPRWSDEGP